MSGPLFSPQWYRVAELRPRLRGHARVSRQRHRGETWYVLEDRAGERFHRFSPAAYAVVGLMDGQRTVREIWEAACGQLGDDAPTQDEVVRLLGQLHAADVLQSDVSPDAAEVLDRRERQTRRRWQGRVFSLLSWQMSLVDPDRILDRLVPFVRPVTGGWGALLWLVVVAPAVLLAAVHGHDLTHGVVDRLMTPGALIGLWVLFPIVKLLHESGHALLTKAYGGEVHDAGLMLLVITPVPYVDASSSWAFPSKWRRMAVGGAGMIVEMFLAALALYVWLAAEPGVVRVLAFNVIVIAGISTLGFHANPLLRFDGYYILSDLLEIPNLRQRGTAYLRYLVEHRLFGIREAEPPAATAGERVWFVVYTVAAFVYRIMVTVAILLFLGGWLPALGLLMAASSAILWLVVPLVKGGAYLLGSPRLRRVRRRAIAVTVAIAVVVGIVVGLLPLPFRTRAEGVVWVPEEARVHAGAEGFVDRIVAAPGRRVRRGDVLILLRDPAAEARLAGLEAHHRETEARYAEQVPVDRVKAELLWEELRYVEAQLAEVRQRVAGLTVRSGADGAFVVVRPDDLPGRFVKRGELLGYTVDLATVTVRAVVSQVQIDLVRQRTRGVEVRLAERLEDPVPATVQRVVPGASERLPTTALGVEGGGRIAVDPRDQHGVTAVERVFQLDVALPSGDGLLNVGGRAYLRFDHGREPLAVQWYHELRQLFLARLNV